MTNRLPEELRHFNEEAQEQLRKGAVKEIEFSGSTYQILIKDFQLDQTFWVFLQLDSKGGIKDGFCSGDHDEGMAGLEESEANESSECLHLAIAYLSLFRGFSEPLHERFRQSLWNHLCSLFEEKLGSHHSIFKSISTGTYQILSNSGKMIFELKGISQAAKETIETILSKKKLETEETSLKFSNLSPEELASWKAGNPAPELRYNLSFWSDIAKWLMRKQEEGDLYQILFQYSKKGVPNWFQINFEDVHIGFYISEVNLPLIIESLKTVKSPLKVHQATGGEIESLRYDKKERELQVKVKGKKTHHKKDREALKINAIPLAGWDYIPGDGFYANEPNDLLKNTILKGFEISNALTKHASMISSLLENSHVYREPIALTHQLQFDSNWNLHIHTFLFEMGDIASNDSWIMDEWVYLEDDGFYRVEGNLFNHAEKIIPIHQVSEFINQYRSWLNLQEGFRTHVRSIEYLIGYQISSNRRLTFTQNLSKTAEDIKIQDFGSWIYMEGHGFYSKSASPFHFFLRPRMTLSAEQIPLFIRMNREELVFIPNFFCQNNPISRAELKIEIAGKRKVKIDPLYVLSDHFSGKELQVFDDFVFLEGEGFYEIPADMRLPEKFRYPLEVEGEELIFFLKYEIDSLYPFVDSLDYRLAKPKDYKLKADWVEPVEEKGLGWYRFSLHYQTENGIISVNALQPHLKKKFYFLFSEAGLLDIRDERFDWIKQLPKDRFEKDFVLLTSLEFMRLNAYEPIELSEKGNSDERSKRHLKELVELKMPEKPDYSSLKSELRPYQEIGVHWLWFLYRHRLSGLLCDDMGLGKTHQTMALLGSVTQFYQSHSGGSRPHYLVVCPTSVIYHWQEKLEQFLPELKVCTFYGIKRSLENFPQSCDLLLTSYGVLRIEREVLSKIPFEVAIFDEIQVAKNQYSRVYEALTGLNAQMKVGLTGTPIENRLRELKSLMDIVLPLYLPGEQHYRDFFIKPIEKENDSGKKTILKRLIHPFTMRRKKGDVLKELPEKIEEVSHCELSPCQKQLYSEVLEKRRQALLDELRNEEGAVPYLHIFALLSSLKQICNHPALYLKKVEEYRNYESGKWDLFIELLSEARESKQKIVVFSQYLIMLDIIESYLKEKNISFASIRGATQNRKEQLEKFNRDPQCEVFVGSLHAAGLGIDLTGGSVVIHYDRWWNAARENQATDRVHRIGQTRGVQVFKLVTKGTFEEKIDAMIQRKGQLLEDVVGVDDQNVLKTFTREELMQLLDSLSINTDNNPV